MLLRSKLWIDSIFKFTETVQSRKKIKLVNLGRVGQLKKESYQKNKEIVCSFSHLRIDE